MELNVGLGIEGLLAQAQKEKTKVEVHLDSGKSIAGIVQGVGDQSVALTELTGKEFFGALVRLEHIAAVEVRLKK